VFERALNLVFKPGTLAALLAVVGAGLGIVLLRRRRRAAEPV
jgi:hypothetical protein